MKVNIVDGPHETNEYCLFSILQRQVNVEQNLYTNDAGYLISVTVPFSTFAASPSS
jgi:hypothetical protein